MNTNFNDDTKEQVRLRADIAAVVGRYVNLKQRGQTMTGLCPFHKEKTPSFTVNPAKGVFHCFGCGKGGDVFRFVQEIEGVGFREALEMLAEETGVRIEKKQDRGGRFADGYYDDAPPSSPLMTASPSSPNKPSVRAAKTELLAIHDEAAKFFYRCVKKHPQAIDYFKSRGLLAETVKEFGLGYAPPGWSALCDHLAAKGIPQSRIIECGLVVSKESGAVYDRFRDRIIFPLCDLSGRAIAFAGRGLSADTQPKYLNSPETPLYQKSRVLYGLHKARQNVRERGHLLILEGYMDYLTLWQAGIRNAAAVSGTAFTADHAHLIKRFASKITLVFDGDRAGLAAARRAAFVLAPSGLQVSILTLPGGDDPDSFVKREGAAAFGELVSSSRAAGDFLVDNLMAEHDDSPHGRSRVVDALMPYVLDLTDSIVRDDFLSRLAHRLRVDRRRIDERLAKADSSRARAAYRDGGMDADYATSIDYPPVQDDKPPSDGFAVGKLEEDFLRILLTSPDLIESARLYISPEILADALSANVYSIILDSYGQKGGLDGFTGEDTGDPEAARLISMLLVKPTRADNIRDELAQKIMLLRRKHARAQMAALRLELKVCPDSEKERLMKEIMDCGEQLKESDLRV